MIRPAPRFAVPLALDPRRLLGIDPAAAVFNLGGETMGTRWSVRLACPPGRDLASLDRAIGRRLDGLIREMSHWLPDSLLARYGEAPAGRWVDLPPDFATVMAAGLAIAARSDGSFDPTIGRLTDAWGLGATERVVPPSPAAIAAALAASGWRRATFDPAARRLLQPGGLRLDLSGIAKGHAVDAVAAVLLAAGITHALVEIGGECRGLGLRPDGDPWWVELETPADVPLAPIRVALHELSVATSGDYVRGTHTLDPSSGLPAADAPIAVSVLHASCMIADAWASALTVMRREAARATATEEALAVRVLERDGSEWISPALAEMLSD